MMMLFPFASIVRIFLSLHANTCAIYIICRIAKMEKENIQNVDFFSQRLHTYVANLGRLVRVHATSHCYDIALLS